MAIGVVLAHGQRICDFVNAVEWTVRVIVYCGLYHLSSKEIS